jgi:hypothetical protein
VVVEVLDQQPTDMVGLVDRVVVVRQIQLRPAQALIILTQLQRSLLLVPMAAAAAGLIQAHLR